MVGRNVPPSPDVIGSASDATGCSPSTRSLVDPATGSSAASAFAAAASTFSTPVFPKFQERHADWWNGNFRGAKRQNCNARQAWKVITGQRSEVCPRLRRTELFSRLKLEVRLRGEAIPVLCLIVLCTFFFATLLMFNPDKSMNKVHHNLRAIFDVEKASQAVTHEEIMLYANDFVHATYSMAAAVVDVTVADTIDPARCFHKNVDDICKNSYWYEETYSRDGEGYLDVDRFETDTLTSANARPSCWDCNAPPSCDNPAPAGSCFDRDDPKYEHERDDDHDNSTNVHRKTWGLLPEEPILMYPRIVYPHVSFTPFPPAVWQVRGVNEPCDGTGQTYNELVGTHVSNFAGNFPNKQTGRKQDFFLKYTSALFGCTDRAQFADEFNDPSWHPWASYEELTRGRPANKAQLDDRPIFWKFVTDIAYLQAPVIGENYIDPDFCINNVTCTGLRSPANCTDPLEVGPDHPMWGERVRNATSGSTGDYYGCSLRSKFTDQFLGKSVQDRKNTFLTLETSELTLAAVFVTPSGGASQDFLTLVRIIFTVDQSGAIDMQPVLQSTTLEVKPTFTVALIVLIILAFLYGGRACYNAVRKIMQARRNHLNHEPGVFDVWDIRAPVLDAVLSLAMIIYAFLLVEVRATLDGEGALIEKFEQSFKLDEQSSYFDVITGIVRYHDHYKSVKNFGFIIGLFIILRVVVVTRQHPRVAVLFRVLQSSSDNVFHFTLYVIFCESILALLAYWMFGDQDSDYSTLEKTVLTMFKMFVGEFKFDKLKTVASMYVLYVFVYVVLFFFVLMNFFLAIIVDSHTTVMAVVEQVELTENSVVVDVYDLGKGIVLQYYHKWPSPKQLLSVIQEQDHDPEKPVSAEELTDLLSDQKQMFPSMQAAEQFCMYYAHKVQASADNYVLVADDIPPDEENAEREETEVEQLRRVGRELEENHLALEEKHALLEKRYALLLEQTHQTNVPQFESGVPSKGPGAQLDLLQVVRLALDEQMQVVRNCLDERFQEFHRDIKSQIAAVVDPRMADLGLETPVVPNISPTRGPACGPGRRPSDNNTIESGERKPIVGTYNSHAESLRRIEEVSQKTFELLRHRANLAVDGLFSPATDAGSRWTLREQGSTSRSNPSPVLSLLEQGMGLSIAGPPPSNSSGLSAWAKELPPASPPRAMIQRE